MTEKNNGGPAFPLLGYNDGMSLRDYFAAKAMQSYVNSISSESWFSDDMINKIAVESYKQADAMLKEREK